MPPFPIILLLLVFIAIAIRKVGRVHLPMWVSMSIAAILVLALRDISFKQAYNAISWNVIGYLFGVFVIGQALEQCYYIERLSFLLSKHISGWRALMFVLIFIFGFSSALLMNDSIAIIGTPLILLLTRRHKTNTTPFLLMLAFAVTLGSVMSPVGNPQNLLIASTGMHSPFIEFLKHLFVPTIINLVVLYIVLIIFYRKELNQVYDIQASDIDVDAKLAFWSKISCLLFVALILLKIILSLCKVKLILAFWMIAIIAAAPLLLFSTKRTQILYQLDWHTLIFFVAMFIFMQAVWLSGYFQHLIQQDLHLNFTNKPTIIAAGLFVSQFVSNVPLVALYLPFLKGEGVAKLLSLAVGSTLAGNIFILGAASNIIIIQNAEKRGVKSFSLYQFLQMGIPLTVINILIYWVFL